MTSKQRQNDTALPCESKLNANNDTVTDAITILVCASQYRATKKFVLADDGSPKKLDYDAGKYFGVLVKPVSDIFTLSETLLALEALPGDFVIRGVPVDPAVTSKSVRRTKENFTTPAVGRHWLLIDFDKIPLPESLDLNKDACAVIEHLVSLLPKEFHDCSYHYQLSSSAGMGDPTKVSAHVWFWLTEPWPDAKLKTWAKAVNNQAKEKLIDAALFNDVQIHYTAAPIFEGVTNPFPTRSALIKKTKDAVSICEIEPPTPSPVQASGLIDSGPGFEGWLARIGDHPGGDGFHEPIIKAIASYVSTHGRDGTDEEALYETIRAKVLAADRSKHDDATVEQRASHEHIMQAIKGAMEKYGDSPARQRKSPHIEGLPAHFARTEETASNALDQLEAAIKGFIKAKVRSNVS